MEKSTEPVTRVTFTGIDAWTDIDALCAIQKKHPWVEFGLLIAKSRQGKENRYPDLSILKRLAGRGLNLSCHVCGTLARDILKENNLLSLDRFLGWRLSAFGRVQLNIATGENAPIPVSVLAPRFIKEIIIQHHPDQPVRLYVSDRPVSILFDASGGEGKEREFIPEKLDIRTGYAGGINPSNAAEKFTKLKKSGLCGDFWIDMETGVRTDDRFDLEKVRAVIDALAPYIEKKTPKEKKPKTFPLDVIYGEEASNYAADHGFARAAKKVGSCEIDGATASYTFDTEHDRELAIQMLEDADGWMGTFWRKRK